MSFSLTVGTGTVSIATNRHAVEVMGKSLFSMLSRWSNKVIFSGGQSINQSLSQEGRRGPFHSDMY